MSSDSLVIVVLISDLNFKPVLEENALSPNKDLDFHRLTVFFHLMDAHQEKHEHDIFIVLSIVSLIGLFEINVSVIRALQLNSNRKALHNKSVSYIKDQLTGRCSVSSLFSEHLALE